MKTYLAFAAALCSSAALADPVINFNDQCHAQVRSSEPVRRILLRETGGATLFKTNLHGAYEHTYGESWTAALNTDLQVISVNLDGSRNRAFVTQAIIDDLDGCLSGSGGDNPFEPVEPSTCPTVVDPENRNARDIHESYALDYAMYDLFSNNGYLGDRGPQNITSTSCELTAFSNPTEVRNNTLDDLQLAAYRKFKVTNDAWVETFTVSIENTVNGTSLPLEDYTLTQPLDAGQRAACLIQLQDVTCNHDSY